MQRWLPVSQDHHNQPRLAAFWQGREPHGNEGEENHRLRTYLQERLLPAMIPVFWQKTDHLPLTSNGKIDRQALRKYLADRQSLSRPAEPPVSLDEPAQWLVDNLAAILDIPPPALDDDIFALGGTSLHIAFLLGKLSEERQQTLQFADIFKHSTVAQMADLLRQTPIDQQLHIPPLAPAAQYTLAPQQRRWWQVYLPEKNRSWATMVKAMNFAGLHGPAQLLAAMRQLVTQQSALRLYFSCHDKILRQHLQDQAAAGDILVDFTDLREETSENTVQKITAIRLSLANQEIDPFSWPLFRVHVIWSAPNSTVVIFAIHHMISDGFSLGLIEQTLRDILEEGQPYHPALDFDYLSWAKWAAEEEAHHSQAQSPAARYWHQVFARPYRKIIFPEKWQGPDQDRGMGYIQPVPQDLRHRLADMARRQKLTQFSVYLAAKFLAWHKILQCEDIVIGTPAAGRELPGSEKLLGNFISLVCIRSTTPGDDD